MVKYTHWKEIPEAQFYYALFLFVLACLLAGCGASTSVELTVVESPATRPPPLLEPRQVSAVTINYQNFRWLDDQTLAYATGGQAEWFAYDLQNGITRSLELPLQQPAPELRSQLPEDAISIGISPSREKVLYVARVHPTPTMPPDVDGEIARESIPSELWLIEEGRARRIGPVEDCIENYLWSNGERYVVARAWEEQVCQARAWWVDLESARVQPLVLPAEAFASVIDLAPSGQRVLIRSKNDGTLYTMQRVSDEVQLLEAAPWAWGKWLDEGTILVGENLAPEGTRWAYTSFWLYDVQRHERSELLSPSSSPALTGQEFTAMSLSPNREWVAFVASNDLAASSGNGQLWITRVSGVAESSVLTEGKPQHVNREYARTLRWSQPENAFVFNTWSAEDTWWKLLPDTQSLEPYSVPADGLSSSTKQALGLHEGAVHQRSPDEAAILYHRQNEQVFELWYADLDSLERRFVITSTDAYEGNCCFDDILWLNDGQGALLTQVIGEALNLWRLDLHDNSVVPWFKGVTTTSEVTPEEILPRYVARSPQGDQLALVGSVTGPRPDQLWILDLAKRELNPVGRAYAGMRPLWSQDGRYVYYAQGASPHYLGAFDQTNPLGIHRVEIASNETATLVSPGVLGTGEIYSQWAISDDEQYIAYSLISDYANEAREGLWLLERAQQ